MHHHIPYKLNNESIPIIDKLSTIKILMHIFDKDLHCIHYQIKLILRFDEQEFHTISQNKLFDHPTDMIIKVFFCHN